jgi:hypothetical protein
MPIPVALFTYKRPEHTRATIKSLVGNQGFAGIELYVFCDGPKTERDSGAVRATREVVRSFKLPNVKIVEREHNLGLANSIIGAVTELCARYGKVIVVEDDLVLSPWFLDYMRRGLELYEHEPRVMQISGHTFAQSATSADSAVFLPLTTTWGWATWDRAWRLFDRGASDISRLREDKALRRRFDLDGVYPYYDMLRRQLAGKLDSWGIRWYLSVFLRDGLTLYPGISLVQNLGFDGSGENCSRLNGMGKLAIPTQIRVTNVPDCIAADTKAFDAVKRAIHDANRRWFSWR